MHPPPIELIGKKFNRLTTIEIVGRRGKGNDTYFSCQCECGGIKEVRRSNLVSGNVKSCGCLMDETSRAVGRQRKTHGQSYSLTYLCWNSMMNRCRNPRCKAFKHYGGRGIAVCDRWKKFENFLADMGEKPTGLSIDRINNDGNYEPGNCKWATPKEQASNRRKKCSAG